MTAKAMTPAVTDSGPNHTGAVATAIAARVSAILIVTPAMLPTCIDNRLRLISRIAARVVAITIEIESHEPSNSSDGS